MAKDFRAKLSGQIGEHLVVAELGRRGIIAAPFAGNVPDIDILTYANGKSLPLQVKSIRRGEISLDARHYLHIVMDGDVQSVAGMNDGIDRNLVFVIVSIGDRIGEDVFYICRQGFIQDIVTDGYRRFLNQHGGVRPRNPKTFHTALRESDLLAVRENWGLIEEALVLASCQ